MRRISQSRLFSTNDRSPDSTTTPSAKMALRMMARPSRLGGRRLGSKSRPSEVPSVVMNRPTKLPGPA